MTSDTRSVILNNASDYQTNEVYWTTEYQTDRLSDYTANGLSLGSDITW